MSFKRCNVCGSTDEGHAERMEKLFKVGCQKSNLAESNTGETPMIFPENLVPGVVIEHKSMPGKLVVLPTTITGQADGGGDLRVRTSTGVITYIYPCEVKRILMD